MGIRKYFKSEDARKAKCERMMAYKKRQHEKGIFLFSAWIPKEIFDKVRNYINRIAAKDELKGN